MPRLWVLTELYYPEETSTGYYMTKIAEGVAGSFDVRVICGQPNYSKRGTRAPSREVHKGVDITRVRSTTFDKNSIPLRLINIFSLAVSVLWAALRRFGKGDRVLVVTTPPLLPFAAVAAGLARGAGVTLLIHDNYPEILIAAGKARPASLMTRSLQIANRWLFKHASKIIVVGRDMHDLVANKSEGLDVPAITIPNWAELETVEPMPREANPLLAELGLSDRFVLLYAGNMGIPNDMETIVAAAKSLRDRTDIHFVFLGDGAKRRWLETTTKENGLANITILDPRPRSEQTNFLNACDVGIVSLVGKMKGVSMPSRTYNILAAGKPVLAIADPGSEVALVVDEENIGLTVSPGGVDEFVNAVLDLASRPAAELREMGARARKAAEAKYSLATAIEAYLKVLR
jgi:glycosyltransferase involved in cell wall biosynthesis